MAQPGKAVTGDNPITITVNSDGSIPEVTLNNAGLGKFEVTYPAGTDTCTITCTAVFSQSAAAAKSQGKSRVGDDYTVSLSSS